MCETGNLIDLTGWDEPEEKEETPPIVDTDKFQGPYDPFDSVEKEACMKAINLQTQEKQDTSTEAKSVNLQYPDLINESPPICMESEADGGAAVPRQRGSNNLFQMQLLKLKAAIGTPQNQGISPRSRFDRIILDEDQQMLSAESPLKLIEDDPNSKFEADLKMLTLYSPMTTSTEQMGPPAAAAPATTARPPILAPAVGVKEHVSRLLLDLQNLVNEKIESSEREPFDSIIASLGAALASLLVPDNTAPAQGEGTNSLCTPHTYTRQGTFDLDLRLGENQRTESLDANDKELVNPGSKMQDVPEAMISSSATFDGESRSPHQTESSDRYITEVADDKLALQINELLNRHNLTKSMLNVHDQGPSNEASRVILVVNSTNQNQLPPARCIVHPSKKTESNDSSMRRRSSSLSLHDKLRLMPDKQPSKPQQSHLENSQNIAPKELHLKTQSSAMAGLRQRRNSFSIGSQPKTSNYAAPSSTTAGKRLILGTRNKMANESLIKSNTGAGIPIKRVVPIIKPQIVEPMPDSLDTPLPARGKAAGQKIFCTSTPLPQMRTQMRRSSLKPLSTTTYSTPQVRRPSFSKKPGSG